MNTTGLSGVAYAVLVVVLWLVSPTVVQDVRLWTPTAPPVTLPFTLARNQEPYHFSGRLYQGWRTPTFLTLRAGDRLSEMSLDGRAMIPEESTTEERQPFRVDLPVNLSAGWHELKWTVINRHQGEGVMDIRQAHGFSLEWAAFAFLLGSAWLWITAKREMPIWTGGLGCAALLLAIHYHVATDPWLRQNDVGGHREYISHLLDRGGLPSVMQGWETWQPPFYYTLAAMWIKAGKSLFPELERFRNAQWLAAALYVLSVAASLLKWQEFGLPKQTGWLGPVLFALLPAHLFLSGKISNDCLMPLWGFILTLLLWRYWKEGKLKILIWIGLTIGASMMTKMSSLAFLLGAALTVLTADQLAHRTMRQRLWRGYIVAAPSLAWLFFWFCRNYEQTGQWMYVNAAISDDLLVLNEIPRFLRFDWQGFLADNFYSSQLRDSFPGALSLSLLTGEFTFEYLGFPGQWIMRATFLPVLVSLAIGVVCKPKSLNDWPWLPTLLLFGSHALFMVAYNWRYPFACNQDSRLWAPVFFPAAVLAAGGFTAIWRKASGWAGRVVLVIPLPFLTLLMSFYAYLFFWM